MARVFAVGLRFFGGGMVWGNLWGLGRSWRGGWHFIEWVWRCLDGWHIVGKVLEGGLASCWRGGGEGFEGAGILGWSEGVLERLASCWSSLGEIQFLLVSVMCG